MAKKSVPSGNKGGKPGPVNTAAAKPAGARGPKLDNLAPIDPTDKDHAHWTANLQGNILNGHGRDHTVNVFIRLPAGNAGREVVSQLSNLVTSALKQEVERKHFRKYRISGRLFGNLLLSANGYRKLGHTDAALQVAFAEGTAPRGTKSNFLDGMAKHAESDLGDTAPSSWDEGFDKNDIDAMVLLADDDERFLLRAGRALIDFLEERGCGLARVERGTALRTSSGEGIEHFGYVDGRSQPLFLASDFQKHPGREEGFTLAANDRIDPAGTRENLGTGKAGGPIDIWDPSAPLGLVLIPDPLAGREDCLGSYFVFRKLEQNVRNFTIAEQKLADVLNLEGEDRERAGAMTVGRFRDGTPLVLSQTDGVVPPKENNFRHDKAKDDKPDKEGLRCPFQGHIRKTNPRGDIITHLGGNEDSERSRRIARRGITYGTRNLHPNAFQALDDLPSKDVGLLFMCFQASIRAQFAFMQRGWANNQDFVKRGVGVGIDPIIGQLDVEDGGGQKVGEVAHTWLPEYDKDVSPTQLFFGGHVTMKGGEFFFAPSIPYLKGLAPAAPASPMIALLASPAIGA